ncbi:MORN repeat-containing protein 5-like [Rhagoletis pomonella]|uniref:MORN repeat-containing protein 5-like n=1 Tax=Rhagoletis pomonella TaxID=28610 RepID=UPI001780208C|nr:MORN repeat-containing protein 5-like [Rhagoletis pomonella]
MHRAIKFCTGSSYVGIYNNPMNCMDGYGFYVYPDGSEYQGHFRRGRFHGVGRIKMAPPYSFTFIGKFENGEMTVINEMIYPDGLTFNADFKSGKIDTTNWNYLSKADRRYKQELAMGLPAVTPHEPLTRYNARTLEPNTYDTEEGIFIEKSRFITQIPAPFLHQRFVSCDKELDWIRKCCRHAEGAGPNEPDEPDARRIIEANIKASTELGENLHTCTCNLPTPLQKFCRRVLRKDIDETSKTSEYSKDCKDELSSPN